MNILKRLNGDIIDQSDTLSIRELAEKNKNNLNYADLSCANLSNADLSNADLSNADLSYADLRGTDLDFANGIKNQKEFLSQFEKTENGIIVYKAIGETLYNPSPKWNIRENKYIEENVNPCRTTLCGCGVSFATINWIKKEYEKKKYDIWECLIEWDDMSDIVVPYNTDGKARCSRLRLLEKLDK
jgi:hypothetical protein